MSSLTYQVVVVSMEMPHFAAGLGLASEFKKRPGAPYTIAISTAADQLRMESSAGSFDEILMKPVTVSALMQAMETALGQRD